MNENSTASTLGAPREVRPSHRRGEEPAADRDRSGASLRRDLPQRGGRGGRGRTDQTYSRGPKSKIAAVAKEFSLDLGKIEIVDVPHSQAAAEKAVRQGRSSYEGKPAYGRAALGSHEAGVGIADGTAHQPCLRSDCRCLGPSKRAGDARHTMSAIGT